MKQACQEVLAPFQSSSCTSFRALSCPRYRVVCYLVVGWRCPSAGWISDAREADLSRTWILSPRPAIVPAEYQASPLGISLGSRFVGRGHGRLGYLGQCVVGAWVELRLRPLGRGSVRFRGRRGFSTGSVSRVQHGRGS